MPQKTFMNLPEERRKEILNVCFREFALYDYESASLSRIIEALDLAKGSFYRYFESKKDLYLYLVDFASKLVYSGFTGFFGREEKDFFENWIDFFMYFSELEKEYPMIIRFRIKTASEKKSVLLKEGNPGESKDRALLIRDIFETGRRKGNITKEVDIEFIALFILSYDFIICEYISQKYSIPADSPVFSMAASMLRQEVGSLIDMARNGLKGSV